MVRPHIYLDENEKTPDERTDLRPNGFTRESVFHDFPIRGQEVLLHDKAFNDIAAAMYDKEDETLNCFVNRSTMLRQNLSMLKSNSSERSSEVS